MNLVLRKAGALLIVMLVLGGCAAQLDSQGYDLAKLEPGEDSVQSIRVEDMPRHHTTIQPGDVLRITRDFAEPGSSDEQTFVVRPDGSFAYPFVGRVEAGNQEPENVAAELAKNLGHIFLNSRVTVNIMTSPSNRVFVGGDVRSPGLYDLTGGVTLRQSIIFAGGLLSTADQENIALIRQNAEGRYDVYLISLWALFDGGEEQRKPIYLHPHDIAFAPKSGIGQAIETMELYFKRLLPFQTSIGAFYRLDNKGN